MNGTGATHGPAGDDGAGPRPQQASLWRLLKEVIGYGLGLSVTRVLGVIIAFIYPVLLSQTEYGSLNVVLSLNGMLSLLLFLGLDVGLPRLYYEREDPAWRGRLTAAVFYTVMAVTLVVVGLMLLLSRPLALLLYVDPRYVLYLRLVLLIVPFNLANGVQLLVLRLEQRIWVFNALSIANLVISAAVGVFCILVLQLGTAGVLVGVLAAYTVTATAGIIVNWRRIWHAPLLSRLREMLAIGLPLVLSNMSLWVLQSVDLLFLVRWVPGDVLGLYAMANGVVGVLAMALTAFQNAWGPFAFSVMDQERSKSVYARTLTFLTALGAGLVVGGTLFAAEGMAVISWLTGKDYGGAAPAIGPLALGTLFYAMYLVVQTGAYIRKNTLAVAFTTALAAAVNIALNFVIIPPWGIVGAALATALGYLTALIVLYFLAQRLAHIPYEMGKVVVAVIVAVAIVAIAPYVVTGALWSDVALKLALAASYVGALLGARVITRTDVMLLLTGLRRRARR